MSRRRNRGRGDAIEHLRSQRVTLVPFIDSILDETSGNGARYELAIEENDLSFVVLLAFIVVKILLTDEAFANEMVRDSAKDTSS